MSGDALPVETLGATCFASTSPSVQRASSAQ
jgi:hypothetical protein